MVFANLSEEEKEAFFALLDEYFSSRPELARALGLDITAATGGALAPAVSAAALRAPATVKATLAGTPEIANAVGRVAAASRAFNSPPSSSPALDPRPTPPLRRGPSSTSHDTSGLITQRRLGDLDTSSGKNMFWGMRNKEKETAPPPAVPAAMPKATGRSFGPPPVRRTTATFPTRMPSPGPEPEPAVAPEPELESAQPEGEWAEALYDYTSSDPSDLQLRENQRILVTARTSNDWWTGEVDGKSGLFPATYVKIL